MEEDEDDDEDEEIYSSEDLDTSQEVIVTSISSAKASSAPISSATMSSAPNTAATMSSAPNKARVPFRPKALSTFIPPGGIMGPQHATLYAILEEDGYDYWGK